MELLERTHAGDTASVNALLAKGTDPNAADGGGVTALMIACDRGDAKLAGRLRAAGASTAPRTAVAGNTCLHYAAQVYADNVHHCKHVVKLAARTAPATTAGGASHTC
eukprot:11302-Heterococcus_DN1.PRE.10